MSRYYFLLGCAWGFEISAFVCMLHIDPRFLLAAAPATIVIALLIEMLFGEL